MMAVMIVMMIADMTIGMMIATTIAAAKENADWMTEIHNGKSRGGHRERPPSRTAWIDWKLSRHALGPRVVVVYVAGKEAVVNGGPTRATSWRQHKKQRGRQHKKQ